MRKITALLTVIMLLVGSIVFSATRNRLEVGTFYHEDAIIQPIKVWVDDNNQVMLPLKGRFFYMLPHHVTFVVVVLKEALELIQDESYTLRLDTVPVILNFTINETKYQVKVIASTSVQAPGQIFIMLNNFEIILGAKDCQKFIDLLEKTEQVSEEIRQQRQDFQFSDRIYEEMQELNELGSTQLTEL